MEAMSSFFHLDKKTANDKTSTISLGLLLQVSNFLSWNCYLTCYFGLYAAASYVTRWHEEFVASINFGSSSVCLRNNLMFTVKVEKLYLNTVG